MKLKLKKSVVSENSDSENEQSQSYQAKIIKLEEEAKSLEEDYKEIEKKLQNTLRSLEDLNQQNKGLLREKATLTVNNKELQTELIDLQAQIAKNRDKTTTLELTFIRTEEELRLAQIKLDLVQEQEKNQNLTNENQDLLKQITNLKAQLASKQTQEQSTNFPVVGQDASIQTRVQTMPGAWKW